MRADEWFFVVLFLSLVFMGLTSYVMGHEMTNKIIMLNYGFENVTVEFYNLGLGGQTTGNFSEYLLRHPDLIENSRQILLENEIRGLHEYAMLYNIWFMLAVFIIAIKLIIRSCSYGSF